MEYRKCLFKLAMKIGRTKINFNKFKESVKSDYPIGGIIPIQNEDLNRTLKISTLKILNELERCGCYSIQANNFKNLETILRNAGLKDLAITFNHDVSLVSNMSGPTIDRDCSVGPVQRPNVLQQHPNILQQHPNILQQRPYLSQQHPYQPQQILCLYLRNEEIDDKIQAEQNILNYHESVRYKQRLEQSGLTVIENNCRRYDEFIEALKPPKEHYECVVVLMLGYRHWDQKIDTFIMNGTDVLTVYRIPDILCDLKKIYCVEKIIFIQLTIPLVNYPRIQSQPKGKYSFPPREIFHIHIHAKSKRTIDSVLTSYFTDNWAKSDNILSTIDTTSGYNQDIIKICYNNPLLDKFIPKSVVIFKITTNNEETQAVETYFSNFVADDRCYHHPIPYENGKITSASWDKLKKITYERDKSIHYDLFVFVITSKRPVSKCFHFQTVEACNSSITDSQIDCVKIFIIDAPLSNQKERIYAPEIDRNTVIIGSYSDRNDSAISCLGKSLAEDKDGGTDFESHAKRAIRNGGRDKLDFRSNLNCLIHIKGLLL